MRKYFLLQCKRVLRILPFVLAVTAVLFGALSGAFLAVKQLSEDSDSHNKFKVGVVGNAGDTYLQMGLAALQSMDSSRFSVELQMMTQQEAKAALSGGKIVAYVSVPDDFLQEAFYGNIIPLQFVVRGSAGGLVTILKDEITGAVETLLLETQRGIYGVGDALEDAGYGSLSGTHINKISLKYVEFVLDRGKVYTTEELGISDGLGLEGYLLCGLSVIMLFLVCMPFAPLQIQSDQALRRLLASRGVGAGKQIACEFTSYLLGLTVLVLPVLWAASSTGVLQDYSVTGQDTLQVLPVLLMVAAFSFFLYELVRDYVSGVLVQFFAAVFLCFFSGCIFPVYTLPKAVQPVANLLPAGAARRQLAQCLTDQQSLAPLMLLLCYTAVLLAGAVLLRKKRMENVRG